MQKFAIAVSLTITLVAVVMVLRTAARMTRVVRLGRPEDRFDRPAARIRTVLTETLGHTRMLRWSVPGLRCRARSKSTASTCTAGSW